MNKSFPVHCGAGHVQLVRVPLIFCHIRTFYDAFRLLIYIHSFIRIIFGFIHSAVDPCLHIHNRGQRRVQDTERTQSLGVK